jgi:DNA-binding response OmpR family regulator
MASRILVVEDEPDILEVVLYNLKQAGFEVDAAEDGESALSRARERHPDLVLLDLMLPGIDGLVVCKQLKQDDATRGIPIIMLTARAEEVDRIVGFELGADDYVVKPFSPRELVLRIRAILRRVKEEATPGTVDEGRISAGPLLIDIDAHTVTMNGHELTLTATEFKLLATLVERRGRVQSRDHLLASVWGYEYGGYGRTVDTHVRRLREKLGGAAGLVETVRGVGYRFRSEG